MNINISHFSRNVVFFLRDNMFPSLTTQQRKIFFIIVSMAFGYLASCYLARRICFKDALQNNPRKITPRETKKEKVEDENKCLEEEEKCVNEETSKRNLSSTESLKEASPVATTVVQSNIPTDVKVTEITVILFCWKDSCLTLQEDYVKHFLGPDVPQQTSTLDSNALPENGPVIFWNDGRGVCRLVPLRDLKKAFNSCRPIAIKAIKVPHDLFRTMFGEMFKTVEAGKTYHVVGGLDSNSAESNFLQVRVMKAGLLLSQNNQVAKKSEASSPKDSMVLA
jgi:hypothetical protein